MIKKLYESKDASLNISVEARLTRAVIGVAYTDEAQLSPQVRMRMLVIHLLCVCFTFTRFFIREATPAETEAEKARHRQSFRSPTRQSGKYKRKQ